MIRLIIFDWDGTIAIGAAEGYINCYRETFKQLGLNFDRHEPEVRQLIKTGPTHLEELKLIFKERPQLIEPARLIYEQELLTDNFLQFISLMPGTKKLLVRLHQKYLLAIATGTLENVVEAVLNKFNIPNLFNQIVTHHNLPDIKLAKPNAYLANQILKTQKVGPKEAIVVGDGAWDIGMAVNAGITPVAVLTGYLTESKARALGAKFVIPDITKLESIIS